MDIQYLLIGAVYSGDIPQARDLLAQGAQIGKDEILHCAAQRGDVAMLDFLLKNGGLPFFDQFDCLSHTPLTWAAKGRDILTMKRLIEAGANVNAVDIRNIGSTALREVVGDGNLQVIELLLGAGADPHIPGWMQMTALDKAESLAEGKTHLRSQILALLNAKKAEAAKILAKKAQPRRRKRE